MRADAKDKVYEAISIVCDGSENIMAGKRRLTWHRRLEYFSKRIMKSAILQVWGVEYDETSVERQECNCLAPGKFKRNSHRSTVENGVIDKLKVMDFFNDAAQQAILLSN